jgi:hypothetical protein
MLELLQRLKPADQDEIVKDVAKLAAKEREVRTLEMLIEYVSSLEEEDLARVWPRLVTAIYSSQTPSQSIARIKSDTHEKSTPSNDRAPLLGSRSERAIVD